MRWKTGDKTYGLQKPTQHFVSQKRGIRFVITIPFSTAYAGLSRLERLVLLACLLVSSNQNQRNHSDQSHQALTIQLTNQSSSQSM